MNNSSPIGLFDSGVGGLTVLQALQKIMPNEDYLYLGDTARLPYGTKSPETVTRYAIQSTSILVARQIKLLIVACNTATAAALPLLQETFPFIPVIGVIEPSAQVACRSSLKGHVAVIATESTIQRGCYKETILKYRPEMLVDSVACPLFVPIVEEGWFNGHIVEEIIKHYLTPIFFDRTTRDQPDCLILGCTHYPLLSEIIQQIIGKDIIIIDSTIATAKLAQACLIQHNMLHPNLDKHTGSTLFLTTDDKSRFAKIGSLFLEQLIHTDSVELVDLHMAHSISNPLPKKYNF